MIVEIPEPVEIAGMILAFLGGLIGLYAYYKLRPYVRLRKMGPEPLEAGRLKYYEEQLVEMKIKLDALSVGAHLSDGAPERPEPAPREAEAPPAEPKKEQSEPSQAQRLPNVGADGVIDHVLQLITDNPMTSRDIQVTLGRSREHTSRLMKKLYEDGFVERKKGARPFQYSLTKKGIARATTGNGSGA